MPPDPRIHCGVAVYIERRVWEDSIGQGEVLLVLRAGSGEYASDGAGKWAMPGGWMDFGETFAQTGERETLEETGITVACETTPMDTVTVMAENGEFQIVVPIVRGRYVSGEPTVIEPDKHDEVCWVPYGEIQRGLPLFGSTERWFKTLGLVT